MMDKESECKRCEAGFDWFERTLRALDTSRLKGTFCELNRDHAVTRLRALRAEVLFLYHALGHRDEAP